MTLPKSSGLEEWSESPPPRSRSCDASQLRPCAAVKRAWEEKIIIKNNNTVIYNNKKSSSSMGIFQFRLRTLREG